MTAAAALLLATFSAAAPGAPGAVPAAPAAPPVPSPPAPPPADGTTATIPGARVVTAQAPVVGGNAAGARERALEDAIRQAVTLALADVVDPQTRAAQAKTIKAIEAKARSFVPRYRTLEEAEVGGMYSVRLEVEVDEIALRRRLERSSAPPPTTTAPPARPGGPSLLLVPADPGEATSTFNLQFRKALAASGTTTQPAAGVETSVAGAAAAAQRAGMDQAVLIAIEMTPEGPVRGTGRTAWSCRANAHVVAAGSGSGAAERTASARVFVEGNKPADSACFTPLIAELGARITGAVTALPSGAAGDLRPVTLDADVVEPAAVPALLKSLRGLGAVSSAELQRVAAGRAEIRVRTRAATPALATALSRTASSMITLSDVATNGDVIRLRARLRPAATTGAGGAAQ
jgi:hypothetical protein